jgi:hypothetical protein
MKKTKTKSPLKEPLLRLPGKSIDEEMNRLSNEKLFNSVLVELVFFFLDSFSWIQMLGRSPLNPWIISFVAAPIIGCR